LNISVRDNAAITDFFFFRQLVQLHHAIPKQYASRPAHDGFRPPTTSAVIELKGFFGLKDLRHTGAAIRGINGE